MSAPTATPEADARQYAFLGMLTLLNVLNFVDRQLLASFANFIVPDLGLTNAEFGLLTGFAFIIFYSVMGLFAGALADVMHRPRLVAGGLALWSALTALSGAARGFTSLALPRMLIGVGESVMTPACMSMLADRFPVHRLGIAAAVYYMGVPLGIGASLLVAGYLGPAIGWRNCFYALGIAGIAMAGLMCLVGETPRRHLAGATPTEAPESLGDRMRALLHVLRTSKALSLTITGAVATHFILGAAAFDQLWLAQERGFERAEIARITGWIGIVGGVLGNLVGGLGADAWSRRGRARQHFLFWLLLPLAPVGLAYRLVSPDSVWFWIGIFGGYVQLGALYGPAFSTVQELAPAEIRGMVMGFFLLALNLIGLGIGITAGGFLIDALIARGVAEPYTWTLLAMSVLSGVSIPCFWAAGRAHPGRASDAIG